MRKALLVLITSQILFWGYILFLETQTQPKEMTLPASLPLYLSDEHGEFDLASAPIIVPYQNEPFYFYRDKSLSPKGMYILSFESMQANAQLSFFVGLDRHITELWLNGQKIALSSGSPTVTLMSGIGPGVYELPGPLIQEGKNTLGVVVDWPRTKVMFHYAIAEAATLKSYVFWGRMSAYYLPIASMGALFFVIILCLSISWQKDEWLRIGVFLTVLLAAALRNLQFFSLEIVSIYPWLHVTHFLAVYLFLLSFIALAYTWTGGGWSAVRNVFYAYIAAVTLLLCGVVFFPDKQSFWIFPHFFFWGYAIETVLTVACVVIASLRLLLTVPQTQTDGNIIKILILFCISVFALEHFDHRFQLSFPFMAELPVKNYPTAIISLILPLGLFATLTNQIAKAKRTTAQMNVVLAKRLAEKEAEIHNHAREITLIEERKRMMRDMHDGIGATLFGLAAQARDKSLSYEHMTNALQHCLDDLRLIVDSLDSAGDNLGMALGAFRMRVEDKLRASGIELIWSINEESAQQTYSVDEILQIYRILQEACTNSMRHSKATQLSITLKPLTDGNFSSAIIIMDNGKGFPDTVSLGHGVNNMKARAQKISGDLRVDGEGEGVRITLNLPM